jgi:hypothetical protein
MSGWFPVRMACTSTITMDDDWREPLTITRLGLACFVGPRLWASAVMRLSWFLKAPADNSPTSRNSD